jgi:cell division transport system ATP-binding protein
VAARFGYFDEWFDEAAFSNTNLKRDVHFAALTGKGIYVILFTVILSAAGGAPQFSTPFRGPFMIRLKDVEMVYENGTRAIQGITLTIEDGEFVFLVGPSGSGKSTIIKLLTGEVEPYAGRIMINGFSTSNISERQIPLMRRTLGVIFQDFRLIDKKTVYDNLAFVMRAVGSSAKEIRQRIPYVLELVGLESKAYSYPTELSGGEQQRVAIARALVNNPNTVIADEPTGNLDPERSLELMDLLVKINALGTTMVVVTHEKNLVDRFGKRVITIDSGHVINDSVGGYVGGHIHG